MINNNKGFSIIIGMGLVVLITLSAYVILDYMVPYSKNTKGIENATNAYYNAYGGIELAMKHVKERSSLTGETLSVMPGITTPIGKTYQTDSSAGESTPGNGNLPSLGNGNSPLNSNFNIISPYEPIQLDVGNGRIINFNQFEFLFRIPDFSSGITLTLSGGSNLYMIGWILSGEKDTLISSGNIKSSDIKPINTTGPDTNPVFKLDGLNGTTLSGSTDSFSSFYSSNCDGTNSGCILKISLLNKLELTDGRQIPFLEYNSSPNPNIIPDRYTTITSGGKSYMYRKDLKVKVPQQTVNQALDFTVFQ